MLNHIQVPTSGQMVYYDITKSEVEYDDNMLISLEGITGNAVNYFSVSESQRETVQRGFFTALTVVFQIDPDLHQVQRQVYNFWEVLGEIGGIYGIVYASCSALLSIINYQKA